MSFTVQWFRQTDGRDINPDLTVTPKGVTVGQGSWVLRGQKVVLEADAVWSHRSRAKDVQVIAYLVRHTGTQAISVLVDEIVEDGADFPYSFDIGPYEELWKLWYLKIPGGTSDLTALEGICFRTKVFEEG